MCGFCVLIKSHLPFIFVCVFQKKLLLVNEMLLFPIALLVVLGPTMPESHNEFESLVLNILCGNLGGLCVWFVCL